MWFDGPRPIGKPELKQPFVNSLREYSKNNAERRYPIEWNIASQSAYGNSTTEVACEEHTKNVAVCVNESTDEDELGTKA